tara:strand:- start:183 stop:584 length:402 start_codon:yes stop_codon:yes gene_type:complete
MTEKYSKEEIEKLIWANPIRKVAKKLGVSDIALHRRCKRLGVVKPPQGHWAKLEHGKPVTTLEEERNLQKLLTQIPINGATLDSKRYSMKRTDKATKRTMEKKQNKTSKPKSKGWKVELYLGSFRTGIQLIKQ